MKRILGTTALMMSLAGVATAQSTITESDIGSVQYQQGDFYASDLIGMRIYNSGQEMEMDSTVPADSEANWEDIGEINDIIVSNDGEVRAVILGVGGFLGMGERDVAISMDDVKVVREEGNETGRFLVVNTTREALEQSPEFDRDAGTMTASTDMENNDSMTDTDTASTDMENNDSMTDTDTASTDMENNDSMTDTDTAATDMENNDSMTDTDTASNVDADVTVIESETATNDTGTTDTTLNDTSVLAQNDRADRPMLTRPTVEREGYRDMEMTEVQQLTSDMVEGSYVYGANDETVGEIDALLMNEEGQVSEVVINVGGFLGLGEKPVAVSFEELQILRNEAGNDVRIYIDSTEEALEAQPEYQQ